MQTELQQVEERIQELPFVGESLDGRHTYWNVEDGGVSPEDIDRGESYARLALSIARQFDLPTLVAMIMRDMICTGKFAGVEAGFLTVVACAARVGSMN